MNASLKYKNGRPIKAGDQATGPDAAGRTVTGVIVAGEKEHHPKFAIKITHGKTEHVTPSLNLATFLHAEDTREDGGKLKPAEKAAAPAVAPIKPAATA